MVCNEIEKYYHHSKHAIDDMDITTAMAIYATCLSTIIFLWDIVKYRKEKTPNIKVNASFCMLSGDQREFITIEVINTGELPILLQMTGFSLPKKEKQKVCVIGESHSTPLPTELTPGIKANIFITPDKLRDLNKLQYAWAQDATGRIYRSRKWPLRHKN